MLRVGTFVGDRYEILGKIGSGGMSDVYKAKCHKLNRLVALKVLKQEFCSNQSFVTRFKVEAQAAAKLTHPNIVAIYDVGDEGNLHYIVMELVEGITLKDYIARKGRLENRETIGISIQVAQGLEAAHAQNIVHRDIKPQNIIISREGKVKVMDFGIAKAVTGDTINSEAIGSVHYISPEQARGGYCDSRSDLYSLGITMYEMLTGSVPFDGENTVSVALAHLQTPMTPPGKQIATVTRSLDKIVLKCTQKAPENRYASATALITDLRKALTMPEGDFVILPPAALREYEAAMAADGTTETESIPQAVLPVQDDLDWTEQAGTTNPKEEEEEAPLFDPEKEDSYAYEDENEDDDYFGNIPEEEDDEEAPTKGDRISLIVSIVLGVIIALLGLYLALRMTDVISSGTDKRESTSTEETETLPEGKTRMPDLIGMEEDEAKQALKEAGLGMTTEYESSDTVKEGLVMRQEYDEDEIIDKNIKVVVTISEGSSSVQIPTTILGKTKDEANAVLKDLNLSDKNITVSYVDQSSDTYAEGTICGMNPSSGIVSSDSTLTLYVSSGKAEKTVSVPSVEGLDVNTAISSLTGVGLSYNQVEASSDTVASGLVISQSVASGTEVAEGTVITLTVSTGKADVYVPGVVGMAQAQAINALEQRNIAYTISEREVTDASEAGIVLEQSVGADSIYNGSTVVLYVGKLQSQTGTLPSSLSQVATYDAAKAIIDGLGLDLNVTRVEEYNANYSEGQIVSISPGAGATVNRGSTITIVVSKGAAPTTPETEETATGE